MTTTLVLTSALSDELEHASRFNVETAGVLLASVVEAPNGDIRLLGKEMLWVEDNAYLERKHDCLSIASHGYVPALGKAERDQLMALWLHTHPGEKALPLASPYDDQVDMEIADLFRLRSESPFYGTIIVSPRPGGFVFSGKLYHEDRLPVTIERLWRVGDAWCLSHAYNVRAADVLPMFDRSVRAFGTDIQAVLGNLKVGVVGCGGTGSAVTEQLVRLGVRNFLLIDPDIVAETNITRVYGSTPLSLGRNKVDVLSDHIIGIAPEAQCHALASMVTLEDTAKALSACDLIFGCTDDNAGRLVLSRISTFLLTPVIDVGVLISSDAQGSLAGIDGRVTVLSPGAACLVCRDRVDLRRAATEMLNPSERLRLENEGYAPALGGAEPAVITFTTAIASAAVNELLERLIEFGPKPRPSEVLYRWHDREISINSAVPRRGHYCDQSSGKWGTGIRKPFLEQVWPEQ